MFPKIILILLLYFFLPQAIFSENIVKEGEGETLSLEDAVNLAVKNNYEIKKQRYALSAAEARYRQAKVYSI